MEWLLSGMTVNERLFAVGLVSSWDEAVGNKDKPSMIAILTKLGLAEQADFIATAALSRSSK